MRIALVIGGGPACAGVPGLVAALGRGGWQVAPVLLPGASDWLGPALLTALCGQPLQAAGELGGEAVILLAGASVALSARLRDGAALADLVSAVGQDGRPGGTDGTADGRRRAAARVQTGTGATLPPLVIVPAEAQPDDLSMAAPEAVCEAVAAAVTAQSLAGTTVLVTAGPTCEDLDPVRFLSNRSTGLMGVALALAAWRHGATVTLVHGPLRAEIPVLRGLIAVPVRSACEMHAAVMARVGAQQVAILCAAVADFTPAERAANKLKKSARERLTLELVRTPDILAAIGSLAVRPLLVGFAAETQDLHAYAAEKLRRKNCDLLCANDITEPGSGFAVGTNRLTLFFRDGSVVPLPQLPKSEAAEGIVAHIAAALNRSRSAESG